MSTQAQEHQRTAELYTDTACDLDREADWPYACDARDRYNGTHKVVVCRSHLVWWHEPENSA